MSVKQKLLFSDLKESRSRKRWTFNWVDKKLNQKGTKYFRIHLDEHSNLKDHVNALERKLLVQSYLYTTSTLANLKLATASLKSNLGNDSTISVIQKAHNKSLRFINFNNAIEPCKSLFKERKLPNLTNANSLNN